MLGAFLRLFNDHGANLRGKIIIIGTLLVAANAAAWAGALVIFHDHPVLLGTCVLAYGFGLRHAVDADHIAAIDNVTRKLMQEGKQPVSIGLWFSLGHSAVVALAAFGIAITMTEIARFDWFKDVGGVISTLVSTSFLLAIAT